MADSDDTTSNLGALLHEAPAAIAILRGAQHVFEFANSKYRQLVRAHALIGRPAREILTDPALEFFYEPLNRVYGSGEPHIEHSRRVVLDSVSSEPRESFWDVIFQAIPEDGGWNGVVVFASDVTELVRAKLEAEHARHRSEQSEHGLRVWLDSLPELTWTALPDGYIDYYNRRWFEYTGTTFEEMQGWGWERVHDPAMLPEVVERWKRSLATGEPFEMEFTLRGADGVRRWFLTRVAPSFDSLGNVIRWFGTNTNINDMKAVQALTAAMTEQSRDAQRMLLEMRADKERAEKRLTELEAERSRDK